MQLRWDWSLEQCGLRYASDVIYTEKNGIPLKMDVLAPIVKGQPLPAVVYIHGGGWCGGHHSLWWNNLYMLWQSGYRLSLPVLLAAEGFAVFSVEYRLSPGALFPTQLEDCLCAIRRLRESSGELGIDPRRIGVWGHSAGGHLAALVGTASGAFSGTKGRPGAAVQAVVDCCGPTDFGSLGKWQQEADVPTAMLIGGPVKDHPDRVRAADPVTYISGNPPPFLIIHGDADLTVPWTQSERLYHALRSHGADATFIRVHNGDHNLTGDGAEPDIAETDRYIIAFLKKHLQGDRPERSIY